MRERARSRENGRTILRERARSRENGRAILRERARSRKSGRAILRERPRSRKNGRAILRERPRSRKSGRAILRERARSRENWRRRSPERPNQALKGLSRVRGSPKAPPLPKRPDSTPNRVIRDAFFIPDPFLKAPGPENGPRSPADCGVKRTPLRPRVSLGAAKCATVATFVGSWEVQRSGASNGHCRDLAAPWGAAKCASVATFVGSWEAQRTGVSNGPR